MSTKKQSKTTKKRIDISKTLYKSNKNVVITGLIGGVGEYFKIDPVLLRLIYVIITAFTGFVPGIVVYLIGSVIVPTRVTK